MKEKAGKEAEAAEEEAVEAAEEAAAEAAVEAERGGRQTKKGKKKNCQARPSSVRAN